MQQYIGTKIIEAVPAIRQGGKVYEQGWPVPLGEGPCEKGYKVRYQDGYESWSPQAAFEEAYRPTNGMSFGLAIEAARKGHKVSRTGWNGKGMYVICRTGHPDGHPYLMIKSAGGSFQMWEAYQSDILTDDWVIVD